MVDTGDGDMIREYLRGEEEAMAIPQSSAPLLCCQVLVGVSHNHTKQKPELRVEQEHVTGDSHVNFAL